MKPQCSTSLANKFLCLAFVLSPLISGVTATTDSLSKASSDISDTSRIEPNPSVPSVSPISVLKSLSTSLSSLQFSQTSSECPSRTINYITHILPQKCLNTDRFKTSATNSVNLHDGTSEHILHTASSTSTSEFPKPSQAGPLDDAKFLSFEEWKKQNLEKLGPPDNEVKKDIPAIPQGVQQQQNIGITQDTAPHVEKVGAGSPTKLEQPQIVNEDKIPAVLPVRHKDAGTTCKERFNYASFDCAATVLKTNPKCKSSSAILKENKDSYMLNECSTNNKFFIVELCDNILVDTIVLANFEYFSSMFRTFRVSVAERYPVKADRWTELGIFTAQNTRAIQAFAIDNPLIWAKYLRIELLTQYGVEYYCPVSLIRVHGTTMIEDLQGEDSNKEEEEVVPISASEASKDSLVTEQRLEKSPENIVHSELSKANYPSTPQPADSGTDSMKQSDTVDPITAVNSLLDNTHLNATNASDPIANASSSFSSLSPPLSESSSSSSLSSINISIPYIESESQSSATQPAEHQSVSISLSSASSSSYSSISSSSFSSSSQSSPISSISNVENLSSASTQSASVTTTLDSSSQSKSQPQPQSQSQSQPHSESKVESNSQATASSNIKSVTTVQQQHAPTPTTQESFYKSIQKRLQVLETNATLSLQYIEEQSRILRDAFSVVEKRQLSQTEDFLHKVNRTIMTELNGFRQQYDQLWQSTVIELETHREQYQREILAVSSRLTIIADELVWQKRMTVVLMSLIVVCLTVVIFSRNSGGALDVSFIQSLLSSKPMFFDHVRDPIPISPSTSPEPQIIQSNRQLVRHYTEPSHFIDPESIHSSRSPSPIPPETPITAILMDAPGDYSPVSSNTTPLTTAPPSSVTSPNVPYSINSAASKSETPLDERVRALRWGDRNNGLKVRSGPSTPRGSREAGRWDDESLANVGQVTEGNYGPSLGRSIVFNSGKRPIDSLSPENDVESEGIVSDREDQESFSSQSHSQTDSLKRSPSVRSVKFGHVNHEIQDSVHPDDNNDSGLKIQTE